MNETVSLVGRTNVGKSSLFNKLIKSKAAIVSDHEGLTRDIKVAELKYLNKAVNLVDTGGFFTSKDDDFEELIIAKAYEAIEQSDKVIFVVDKKFGLSPVPDKNDYTIQYEYWHVHTDLSAHGDTMDLDDRFKDVITTKAKYYAYILRSDPQAAAMAVKEYDNQLQPLRSEYVTTKTYMRDTRVN